VGGKMGKSKDTSSKASQSHSLVIVESPAKAKTIKRYLGVGYVVEASLGHVRDLPPRQLGVDLNDQFRPTYEILTGRKRAVGQLKKRADTAEWVYLATDLDREGEAIAWHLVHALSLPPEKVRRVVFNEITAGAIRRAFATPRQIDLDKVNAQQARRILDRIVGYQLSPLLWRKIAKGLSAGRVQSVAVRLIVEREGQIRAFVPQEQWRVTAYFTTALDQIETLSQQWHDLLADGESLDRVKAQQRQADWVTRHECVRAELTHVGGKPFDPASAEQVRGLAEALGFVCEDVREEIWEPYAAHGLKKIELVGKTDPSQSPPFAISKIETKRTRTHPSPPFTTATLQQRAANRMRFSASRTMRVAQALYEGIDLGNSDGPTALITYMRTDSTNLSGESVEAARSFVEQQFGKDYVPPTPRRYSQSARAQEAHEAIRPTDVMRTPESLKGKLSSDHYRLYDMIWRRFVACQMNPAEWDATTVLITADTGQGEVVFRATGRKLVFDGFLKVAGVETGNGEQILPHLEAQQPVGPIQINPQQQFTSPPPRYSEASLIKALEAEGIGRPSTYAAIIKTIQDRKYVEQMDRRFHPTQLGETVTAKLVEFFPKILDVKFTSHMEDQLDKIEEAHLDWQKVLHEFYDPFEQALNQAHEGMTAAKAEPSEYTCPECDKEMVYRWGPSGRFLACSGYPDCKTSSDIDDEGKPIKPEATEHPCDVCGKPMMLRRSRHGLFLGCSGYPECANTIACNEKGEPLKLVTEAELTTPCDQCDGKLVVKRRGRRAFLGCSNYPDCKNTQPLPKDVRLERKTEPPEMAGFACDGCGKPMVIRSGRRGRFIACTGFPRCRNTKPIEQLDALRAAAAERAGGDASAAPAEPPAPAEKARSAKKAKKTAKGKEPVDSAADTPREESAAASGAIQYTKKGNPYVEQMNGAVACPTCGAEMIVRRSRFGPFLSCGGFPNCKQTVRLKGDAMKQAEEQLGPAPARAKTEPTDIDCDACGAKMVIRSGRAGRFLGCSTYPKCKNTKPLGSEPARTEAP